MFIVAGKIFVQEDRREEFIALSSAAVELARRTEGCQDFAVSPDPVDPTRVNVFELWVSEDAVRTFRGQGPSEDFARLIERTEIDEYHTTAS